MNVPVSGCTFTDYVTNKPLSSTPIGIDKGASGAGKGCYAYTISIANNTIFNVIPPASSNLQSLPENSGGGDTIVLHLPPKVSPTPAPTPTPCPNQVDVSGSCCFIAHAAFGSPMAKEVQRLRQVRRGFLLKSKLGTEFFARLLQEYYQFSPWIEGEMESSTPVKNAISALLVKPFLGFITLFEAWTKNPASDSIERKMMKVMSDTLSDLDQIGVDRNQIPAIHNALSKLHIPTGKGRLPEKATPEVYDSHPERVVDSLNILLQTTVRGNGDYVTAGLLAPWKIYWSTLDRWSKSNKSKQAAAYFSKEVGRWLSGVPIPDYFDKLKPKVAEKDLAALSKMIFTHSKVRHDFGARLLRLHGKKVTYDLKALLRKLDYLPRSK